MGLHMGKTNTRLTGMYELLKKDGKAKRGRFHTVHGTIETPVFMNVGTAAAFLKVQPEY